MSFGGFGVSVGDAFAIGNFAWNVYKACKSAPVEFKEISKEVASLHTAIREVSDEEQNADSILNRSGHGKKIELEQILSNCRDVLADPDGLLNKHGSLATDNKKPLDRLRFGRKDINAVRDKLVFHTGAINLFLTTLGTGSLGRIERRLDDLVQEMRNGMRELTTVLVFGNQDELQDVKWTGLEAELQAHDISPGDIRTHRNGIRAYLQEQVEKFELPLRNRISKSSQELQDMGVDSTTLKSAVLSESARSSFADDQNDKASLRFGDHDLLQRPSTQPDSDDFFAESVDTQRDARDDRMKIGNSSITADKTKRLRKLYGCGICNEDFESDIELYFHGQEHEYNALFVCRYSDCGKTYQSTRALAIHVVNHQFGGVYNQSTGRGGFPSPSMATPWPQTGSSRSQSNMAIDVPAEARSESPISNGRRHDGLLDHTLTDVQEYDEQGRLRKRTITRQGSNTSLGSNTSFDSSLHDASFNLSGHTVQKQSRIASLDSGTSSSYQVPVLQQQQQQQQHQKYPFGKTFQCTHIDPDTNRPCNRVFSLPAAFILHAQTRHTEEYFANKSLAVQAHAPGPTSSPRHSLSAQQPNAISPKPSPARETLDQVESYSNPKKRPRPPVEEKQYHDGENEEYPGSNEMIANLEEMVRSLTIARDHYRKERNYFQKMLSAAEASWPLRPPSPPEI